MKYKETRTHLCCLCVSVTGGLGGGCGSCVIMLQVKKSIQDMSRATGKMLTLRFTSPHCNKSTLVQSKFFSTKTFNRHKKFTFKAHRGRDRWCTQCALPLTYLYRNCTFIYTCTTLMMIDCSMALHGRFITQQPTCL